MITETTIPIQMTTDDESTKHTEHSIPMKNDQHTTGIFLIKSFDDKLLFLLRY